MPTKRYWLRGGVVGFILGILVGFFPISILRLLYPLFVSRAVINSIIGGIANCGISNSCPSIVILAMFVVPIIFYVLTGFVVGSVAGWIYGKIKNRNRTIV